MATLEEMAGKRACMLLDMMKDKEFEDKVCTFTREELEQCGYASLKEFCEDMRGLQGYSENMDSRKEITLSGYARTDTEFYLAKDFILDYRDYDFSVSGIQEDPRRKRNDRKKHARKGLWFLAKRG